MRVAVVGSRNITIENIEKYLPEGTKEVISGGAKGVDTSARSCALRCGFQLTEILPEYQRYGKAAPIKRNELIIEAADFVLVFWDGKSHGTAFVIEKCRKKQIPHQVYIIKPEP